MPDSPGCLLRTDVSFGGWGWGTRSPPGEGDDSGGCCPLLRPSSGKPGGEGGWCRECSCPFKTQLFSAQVRIEGHLKIIIIILPSQPVLTTEKYF